MLSQFFKITFLLYALLIISNTTAQEKNKSYNFPGPHVAVGFNNRLSQAQFKDIHLRYINIGSKANDTFNYDDHLNAYSNLITFNFGMTSTYHFFGTKIDIGVVPFANRNYNINLSAFGLIPFHRDVTFSAEFGYTRLRKKRILGTLEGKDHAKIELNDYDYSILTIMAHQVSHSYFFGLGAYINLGSDYYLHLNTRYHKIFRQRNTLKVAARDNEDPLLFEAISYDDALRYGLDHPNLQIKDEQGNKVSRFYNPGDWNFTAQLCIPFGDLEGHSYTPKKFFGAQ